MPKSLQRTKENVASPAMVVVNTFHMIRSATANDYLAVSALLESETLPTADLDPHLSHFFVMTEGNEVVGSIGLELYGDSALLRSMVVSSGHRKKGIAIALINQLTGYAKERNVGAIFLITNTAENYFKKLGFHNIRREDVDQRVLTSKEFNGLCPASSAIMMKHL